MRWQLSRVIGTLGSNNVQEALAGIPVMTNGLGQSWIESTNHADSCSRLWAHVEPLLNAEVPNWIILPDAEKANRDWWQARAGKIAEVGFGRAATTLALSQLDRLGVPGRLVAVDSPSEGRAGVEGVLALDWVPDDHGLVIDLARMDGRIDGKTDLGAILLSGREVVAQPELVMCSGVGGEDLERLLPFMTHLGAWAGPDVRWEFPEAGLGRLGVVGSLYNLAWLEAGYRLGDWSGSAVMLELDSSPLVGLSVIRYLPEQDVSANLN